MNENIILDFFKLNNIEYTLYKHQPVFTVEDIPILIDSNGITEIPGLQSKSLFLKDKKSESFFLVSVTENKRVDLKALSDTLGSGRFSFGQPEELLDVLKLTPGSVTPFGLIFDKENKVTFVIDQDFLQTSFVNFHPLRNDMTIGLTPENFLKSMKILNHEPKIIEIPVKTG